MEKSKEHFYEAFKHKPLESKYLFHLRFYESLPKVSIVLPTLGRPEGLERCLGSVKKLNYPEELVELIVLQDEPRLGVPKRVKEGTEKATGDVIVFASNDVEFTPDSLILAVLKSKEKGLVAFDTGKPDECEPQYAAQPKSNVAPGQLSFFDLL